MHLNSDNETEKLVYVNDTHCKIKICCCSGLILGRCLVHCLDISTKYMCNLNTLPGSVKCISKGPYGVPSFPTFTADVK